MKSRIYLAAIFFLAGCQGGGDSNSDVTIQQFDCSKQEEVPLENAADLTALEEKVLRSGATPKVIGDPAFPGVAVTADCGSVVSIDFTSDTTNIGNTENAAPTPAQ